MERVPILSTAVESVGYDPRTHLLEVEYADGGVYRYFGVPPVEYAALMRAGSLGAHLNARIKPRFRFVRLT